MSILIDLSKVKNKGVIGEVHKHHEKQKDLCCHMFNCYKHNTSTTICHLCIFSNDTGQLVDLPDYPYQITLPFTQAVAEERVLVQEPTYMEVDE